MNASMEPRYVNRGNPEHEERSGVPGQRFNGAAVCEPRKFHLSLPHVALLVIASMEPRYINRGTVLLPDTVAKWAQA